MTPVVRPSTSPNGVEDVSEVRVRQIRDRASKEVAESSFCNGPLDAEENDSLSVSSLKRSPPDSKSNSNEPRKKRAYKMKTLHVKRDQYVEFFNDEVTEFFTGVPYESHLRPSQISLVKQDSHRGFGEYGKNHTRMFHVHWSVAEKEKFFTFLGRYGINRIEEIQKLIPTKSVVEIRCYYQLLKDNLIHIKSCSKIRRQRLVKYSDIPIAYEMDPSCVHVEELLAYSLLLREKNNLSKDERQSKFKKILTHSASKDCLIDVKELESLSPMYITNELRALYGMRNYPMVVTFNAFPLFTSLAIKLTREIIKDLIISNLSLSSTISRPFETGDDGNLIIEVKLPQLLRVLLKKQREYNRPLLLDEYSYELPDRFGFEVRYEETNRLCKAITKGRLRSYVNQLEPKTSDDIVVHTYDDTDDRGFIVDDSVQDNLLDDRTTNSLFVEECEMLREKDKSESQQHVRHFLENMDVVEYYEHEKSLEELEDADTEYEEDMDNDFMIADLKRTVRPTKNHSTRSKNRQEKSFELDEESKDPNSFEDLDSELDQSSNLRVKGQFQTTDFHGIKENRAIHESNEEGVASNDPFHEALLLQQLTYAEY